ncbi:MAG TPA: thiamine pyrophosphate-dependent enzyme [Xanthobacteraceae bacterium]|nr:thiamine pyrophosphate-dependent enzyme [Xanthobacteraceae bacterium]
MERKTTAEATVEGLIAHGIDTMYALPGVHNDHLFEALFKAKDRIRTVHTRHEQGAGYMALGAALATGKPQAYAVVPGPGLLNSATALLNAHGTNAPVLALIGQIAQADIGRGYGHLHEIRDQAGIISRIVGHTARIKSPAEAPALVADAFRAMRSGRPGPAALECAIDMWGKSALMSPPAAPAPTQEQPVDEDAIAAAAKRLASAARILIVAGGGAQDASPEVTALSTLLQAPVFSFRRGRGVLDGRSPFSVTSPLGHELWGEADVVLGIGTRMFNGFHQWGIDDKMSFIRVDADPEEPDRFRKAAVSLVGDAAPILRRLIAALDGLKRASREDEMVERQAKWRKRMAKLAPQIGYLEAIRDELGDDGVLVEEVTQMGFAARLLYPVYKPRTFISPGFQDSLGWGYATALGVQDALRDKPVVAISGDGGFMFTATEMATAMHHRIPLTVVVFNDGAFGNVRRIQEERYGNRVIASDLTNPDFVRFAESFGAAADRVRNPSELRAALNRSLKRRDQPTLIEVPVGPLPSPWEFLHLPKVRG